MAAATSCCLSCTHDFFPARVRNPGRRAVWRRQSARPHASAGNFLFNQNKFWLPGVPRWAEGQEVGWSNPHLSQGPRAQDLTWCFPSGSCPLLLLVYKIPNALQTVCPLKLIGISLIICLCYSGTKIPMPQYGLQLNSPYSGSWS